MSEVISQTVQLPSGEATYLEAGSRNSETVVLLHGGGLDCARLSWRLLIPALSTTYRVIAPDWPGYGGSQGLGRPYQIADIGQWLIVLLDHLQIETASMVGLSMGGGAALWSAINRPERVKAVVPVASYGIADRVPLHTLTFLLTKLPLNAVSFALLRRSPKLLRRSVEALFADPKRVTPQLVAEVAEVLQAAGAGAAFTQFQRGETGAKRLRTVFGSEIKTVSQPMLFIHGAQDALVPLDAVERAARSLKTARLEVMDTGHWPMREQPETFNDLVLSFLNQTIGQA
ncbi:MAG: alpha/beta fold hydrolase [Pseudomonadota bacterium]